MEPENRPHGSSGAGEPSPWFLGRDRRTVPVVPRVDDHSSIVQYMKYLNPRGVLKKPLTLESSM